MAGHFGERIKRVLEDITHYSPRRTVVDRDLDGRIRAQFGVYGSRVTIKENRRVGNEYGKFVSVSNTPLSNVPLEEEWTDEKYIRVYHWYMPPKKDGTLDPRTLGEIINYVLQVYGRGQGGKKIISAAEIAPLITVTRSTASIGGSEVYLDRAGLESLRLQKQATDKKDSGMQKAA